MKPHTIEFYIENFPKEVQEKLISIKQLIEKLAPQATPCINYGIPTYKLRENLVHFAAYKNHIGFYPSPEAIAFFEEQLKTYKTAKGSIQFPLSSPLPLDLIKVITLHRIQKITLSK